MLKGVLPGEAAAPFANQYAFCNTDARKCHEVGSGRAGILRLGVAAVPHFFCCCRRPSGHQQQHHHHQHQPPVGAGEDWHRCCGTMQGPGVGAERQAEDVSTFTCFIVL